MGTESSSPGPQKLFFSNGIVIDWTQIAAIESNQQSILLPGEIGELEHLLDGQPSNLLVRLTDGSTVNITAGSARLQIRVTD